MESDFPVYMIEKITVRSVCGGQREWLTVGWCLQDRPEPLRRAEDGRKNLRCRTICLHLLVVFGVSTFFTWLCFCTK